MASEYEKLGASASKAGLHGALRDAGVELSSSLFCSVNNDFAGDPDYYSFIHCDGAGTKSIVSYLSFRENNNLNVYAGLSQDALVMNLDDVMCLGTPQRMVLGNAIARNSRLVSDAVLGIIVGEYRKLVQQLNSLGVAIELGGGETADTPDVVRTLLVDAVVSGRIPKKDVITNDRIAPGDIIIGLASTGKATYEAIPNSGIGSNGLTLARHALLHNDYLKNYPEVVDGQHDISNCYRGPFHLNDKPNKLDMSVGDALRSPTRTYAPVLVEIYRLLGSAIHGAIHVTGGGLTKVVRFGAANNLYIKDNLFPVPPIFSLIQQHGNVPWREMYQVFNMGHRFELYVPQDVAKDVIKVAEKFAIAAQIIGRVERNGSLGGRRKVIVTTSSETFEYTDR